MIFLAMLSSSCNGASRHIDSFITFLRIPLSHCLDVDVLEPRRDYRVGVCLVRMLMSNTDRTHQTEPYDLTATARVHYSTPSE